jgi:GMP synthase (glutamine-hydrolysing)
MNFEAQVWIVDFGSQYTQLITRKTRELGHSAVMMTVEEGLKGLETKRPKALILSGGPDSISQDSTDFAPFFKDDTLPTLGICYGMQVMAQHFGGSVEKGTQGEYGHSQVEFSSELEIEGVPSKTSVWMSHFDHVAKVPSDFKVLCQSRNDFVAGMIHTSRPLMGLQFHPEVKHTHHGKQLLKYFFNTFAKLDEDWTSYQMYQECLKEVEAVADKDVLCAFSGGVDSLVAASLAEKVLKGHLHCFFVDNGLLRPQDYHHIEILKKNTNLHIEVVDAKEIFLSRLEGVDEPEEKRKIIGRTFIEVFEQKVHEFEHSHQIKFEYLLQGTLYPDVIESTSPHLKGGKSVTIKSHHNVGGLPERMHLKLLEPLKFLFKDEVRELGETLGLKHEWVHRHPFPGPGIGVRILGRVAPESVKKVQDSDQILFEELHNYGLYESAWQAFTVLLPVKTVGIKGDARAYEEVICLRIVGSTDGMTAHWTEMPYDFLSHVSARITNEVAGITRVVYDITSKPPGTIEWE